MHLPPKSIPPAQVAPSHRDVLPPIDPREILVVLSVTTLLSAAGAVVLGQDNNWDLRNYHYYVAYAFLHDRLEVDIAAAQIQSWFNPLGHLLHYAAISHLRPLWAGALMGGLAAVPICLVYLLVRLTATGLTLGQSRFVATLAAAVAGSGAIFISELGTTFVDILWSSFFLGSLALFARLPEQHRIGFLDASANRSLALAGVLAGIAVGLKLVFAAYALALVLALFVTWPRRRFSLAAVAWFGAGLLAGFGLSGGYWAYTLWSKYGNPVFPFYNGIFESPWYPLVNTSDPRHVPRSLLQAALYPFRALIQWRHPGAEVGYRDARYAVVILLAVVALIVLYRGRLSRNADGGTAQPGVTVDPPLSANDIFILAFFFLSAAIVLKMFGILRYTAPLELLSGVVTWTLLRITFGRRVKRAFGAFAAIFVTLLATTIPPDWHRVEYQSDWFGVSPPPSVAVPGTLYLALGKEPIAYSLAFLSADPGPMIGLHNFFDIPLVRDPSGPWHALAIERIRRHPGPIRTISIRPMMDSDRTDLEALGVRVIEAECERFSWHYDHFLSCRCDRIER